MSVFYCNLSFPLSLNSSTVNALYDYTEELAILKLVAGRADPDLLLHFIHIHHSRPQIAYLIYLTH